jgi:hypothetical protein
MLLGEDVGGREGEFLSMMLERELGGGKACSKERFSS